MSLADIEPYLPAVVVIALLFGGLIAAGAGAARDGHRGIAAAISMALVVLAAAVGFLVIIAIGLSRAFD